MWSMVMFVFYIYLPLSCLSSKRSDAARKQERILYKIERYPDTTFSYKIPIEDDGDYVILLKFSETKSCAPGVKVFDVVLNSQHIIPYNLDIFNAYTDYIEFKVYREKLYWDEEVSEIKSNKIRVDFIYGEHGAPSISTILFAKGNINNVPKLLQAIYDRELQEQSIDWNKKLEELFFPCPSIFSKQFIDERMRLRIETLMDNLDVAHKPIKELAWNLIPGTFVRYRKVPNTSVVLMYWFNVLNI